MLFRFVAGVGIAPTFQQAERKSLMNWSLDYFHNLN